MIFAGNKETASFAIPSKITVDVLISSKLISDVSKNFAPFKERGCFVVVIDIDSSSSFTDFIPSSPAIAPDGRYIVFLKSLQASDKISYIDSSSSAPTLMIIRSFLFCKTLNDTSITASWDAASTTMSTGFEDSKCEFSTISGLFVNFSTNNVDFSFDSSKTCVSVAGI